MNNNEIPQNKTPGIKICGLRSLDDIAAIAEANVDYGGFVFAASKRQISLAQAAELIKSMPSTIESVGVFVNETPAKVREAVLSVHLDIVQLHGNEDADYLEQLRKILPVGIKIWRSYSFNIQTADSNQTNQPITRMKPDAWLLDSFLPDAKTAGGTGLSFDWEQAATKLPLGRIILAGGLNADNVRKAISIIKPDIVDCSSGVETAGRKNRDKIIEFCRTVRQNS
jgi:phosphoribosylanthranilate isomerase